MTHSSRISPLCVYPVLFGAGTDLFDFTRAAVVENRQNQIFGDSEGVDQEVSL
jgi:hypothetical protein